MSRPWCSRPKPAGRGWCARAVGFVFHRDRPGERLAAVRTNQGEVACERAVIAAGIASAALARQAGDRIPLASERGYHVVWRDAPVHLPLPVMPSDGKMALTPTLGGLRVAGQVDLAAVSAPPDWRRAELLARFARQVFPALRQDSQGAQATASAGAQGPSAPATRWLGHRPSTPDGLPVIGPSPAHPAIVHAFGHGHVGLAAAPASAELVADLIAGRVPTLDARPYRASRF